MHIMGKVMEATTHKARKEQLSMGSLGLFPAAHVVESAIAC